MPLKQGSRLTWKNFNIPLSYRLNETETRFRDCLNVFSNQGRLETRHGTSRLTASSLGGSVLSLSFFKDTEDAKSLIAKVGSDIFKVDTLGTVTLLRSGLGSSTKHRGITLNNKHILTVENDGLFQYDGTTFTQLGQLPPVAPSVAVSGAGNSLTASSYQVTLTFYSSLTGFETNQGVASSTLVVGSGEQIDVTSIPATADNGTIDKVRIYLKNVSSNSDFIFWKELSLGVTTDVIDEDPISSQTPPVRNASPQLGGGKFLTEFNERLVYAGNDNFKNDIFFSEPGLPDAFNDNGSTQILLTASGGGAITGLAVGLYNNDSLNPYLAIFKKTSTHIYSELGGSPQFVKINNEIGCVSNETIQIKNGNIYFLSQRGWRVISNGRLIRDKGEPITLGLGDIDDVFKNSGFSFEVNKAQFENFFSVYYETLDQYFTFIAEGASTTFNRAYLYEFDTGGFKAYLFPQNLTSAVVGEDLNGNETVFLSDTSGHIYTHSISESRTDANSDDVSVKIPASALIYWVQGKDFDSSYNFRELIVRAVNSVNEVTVQALVNFSLTDLTTQSYSFPSGNSGFVLDVSKLDEGLFGDERQIVTARSDINRVGENIAIGFYQEVEDGNINLVDAQLHFSKNGNRN